MFLEFEAASNINHFVFLVEGKSLLQNIKQSQYYIISLKTTKITKNWSSELQDQFNIISSYQISSNCIFMNITTVGKEQHEYKILERPYLEHSTINQIFAV